MHASLQRKIVTQKVHSSLHYGQQGQLPGGRDSFCRFSWRAWLQCSSVSSLIYLQLTVIHSSLTKKDYVSLLNLLHATISKTLNHSCFFYLQPFQKLMMKNCHIKKSILLHIPGMNIAYEIAPE